MKKVLLVCDDNHFPNGAFELAKQLNKLNPVFLKGIFLNATQYAGLWAYPVHSADGFLKAAVEKGNETPLKRAGMFAALCEENNLECRYETYDENFVLSSLRNECRFADLLLMSSEWFYNNFDEAQPNSYTKTILHNAECPVLLVPEAFNAPASIILSYDGSDECVFAIRQFAYLLPEWCNLETFLVYESSEEGTMPELDNIKELVSHHFSSLSLVELAGMAENDFTAWAGKISNGLVVGGSFGRTAISRLFKKSFLNGVIQHHKMPVFIAHK